MTNNMSDEEKSIEIANDHKVYFYGKKTEGLEWEVARKASIEMANWKNEQFWSKENIEKIIITYSSFSDRSCPGELVKKTIEKLKPNEHDKHRKSRRD